ncbi:unnamed protein product [Mucor circinelloides]
MPKIKTPISDLVPENRIIIDKLSFYREHIACVKCAEVNTLYYNDNIKPSNANTKPKRTSFKCITPQCPFKPTIAFIERKISNLEKPIHYVSDSNKPTRPSKTPRIATTARKSGSSTIAPEFSELTPGNNNCQAIVEPMETNANPQIPDIVAGDTTTFKGEIDKQPSTSSTENSNQIAELIIDLVKSLQSRLDHIENAALHQQVAQITKAMQMEAVLDEPTPMEEAPREEQSNDVHFNKHSRSKSTPISLSSAI